MTKLFINIKELIQVRDVTIKKVSGKEMNNLPTIKNAFLLIDNELIKSFGTMEELQDFDVDQTIDCTDKMILPSWCDSHTHIVYAGNREQEFIDRINGLSYEEIAENGGGILNSAKKLQETSEDDLYKQSLKRVKEVINLGTGALEIKSGYGLTIDSELKMLRVINRLKKNLPIPIRATFLGAHAIPNEFKKDKDGYLDLIINQMLPRISEDRLADFIDVFCEIGYFNLKDTQRILAAGKKYGLISKVHVNQFNSIGGVKVSVNNDALTVDHLEVNR